MTKNNSVTWKEKSTDVYFINKYFKFSGRLTFWFFFKLYLKLFICLSFIFYKEFLSHSQNSPCEVFLLLLFFLLLSLSFCFAISFFSQGTNEMFVGFVKKSGLCRVYTQKALRIPVLLETHLTLTVQEQLKLPLLFIIYHFFLYSFQIKVQFLCLLLRKFLFSFF